MKTTRDGKGSALDSLVATDVVVARTQRRAGAPVAFAVTKGELVRALTGVVVTMKAGRVRFRKPTDLATSSGTVHIEPDKTLFLLTYQGDGFTKAWFEGKLYKDVDVSHFLDEVQKCLINHSQFQDGAIS